MLSEKMVLDREFAVSDALNFKTGIFTDVLNEIMIQTASREPEDAGNAMKYSHHLCQFIQFFERLFHIFFHGQCHLLSTLQIIP